MRRRRKKPSLLARRLVGDGWPCEVEVRVMPPEQRKELDQLADEQRRVPVEEQIEGVIG